MEILLLIQIWLVALHPDLICLSYLIFSTDCLHCNVARPACSENAVNIYVYLRNGNDLSFSTMTTVSTTNESVIVENMLLFMSVLNSGGATSLEALL